MKICKYCNDIDSNACPICLGEENMRVINIKINIDDAEAITLKSSNWTQNYQKAMYTLRDTINKELNK